MRRGQWSEQMGEFISFLRTIRPRLDRFFENGSSVENIALLVARIREDTKLVNALARLALQLPEYRQRWFRKLSSEANKQRLAQLLETYFIL